MTTSRKPYPSDVADAAWARVAPYLTLVREDARQREHPRRELFNGLRDIVKTGAPWRWMPKTCRHRPSADPPEGARQSRAGPRSASRRNAGWRPAASSGSREDLRAVLRLAAGRDPEPSAAVFDSRTLRASPESGERAGDDGAKRKWGAKLPLAVDRLGHLLALHVTPADADDRAEVGRLAAAVQAATGGSVDLAYVDQGYLGDKPAEAARQQGIELAVVKLPEAIALARPPGGTCRQAA